MSRGPAMLPDTPPGFFVSLLPLAGFLLWFVVGLPWGPHNEAFDWIVRLDTLSLFRAAFAQLPSVITPRPLGVALAWLTYRLGGHDTAATQFLNAGFALLAWWWLARAVPARRLFALVALVVGGIGFAGYIWVFHVHGIFYGPLLLFVAWLVRRDREAIRAGTLATVAAVAALTALAHPFALPLAVAFAAGAMLEHRPLRSAAGWRAAGLLVAVVAVLYVVLVPAAKRGLSGDPLLGWRVSFATTEVNRVVSLGAIALAGLAAHGLATGPRRVLAVAGAVAAGAALLAIHGPVLPLWLALCALVCVRHGRWTLLALLAASALIPLANPTGSPTYAVFVLFVAAAVTAQDRDLEAGLRFLREPVAAVVLAGSVGLGLVLRAGVNVPVASRAARPLLAERERSLQMPEIARRLLRSPERASPLRFARGSGNPVDVDATDRRYRPPTEDRHLATWLDHLRGGPATGETLFVAFGDDPRAAGGQVVLSVHGRYAGDATVFRRPSFASADTIAHPFRPEPGR